MITKDSRDVKDGKQGHDDTEGQDDITNVGREKIRGEKYKTEQITLTKTKEREDKNKTMERRIRCRAEKGEINKDSTL